MKISKVTTLNRSCEIFPNLVTLIGIKIDTAKPPSKKRRKFCARPRNVSAQGFPEKGWIACPLKGRKLLVSQTG